MARLPLKKPKGLVRSGLIAEYRFTEGAGSTSVVDYSGRGHTGTLLATTGAPTWNTYGLDFDGGDGVSFTNSTYWDFTSGFSMVAVVCCSSDHFGAILSRRLFDADKQGFYLAKQSGTPNGYQMTHYNTAGNAKSGTNTVSANGTWNVITGWYDGTNIDLYVNKSGGISTGSGTHQPCAAQNPTAGKYSYTNATFLVGSLAYVAVYNRALTSGEITQNYNYLKSYCKNRKGISIV